MKVMLSPPKSRKEEMLSMKEKSPTFQPSKPRYRTKNRNVVVCSVFDVSLKKQKPVKLFIASPSVEAESTKMLKSRFMFW